jgi:ATP-dependent RNA helicase SUPV3L1/SUV3
VGNEVRVKLKAIGIRAGRFALYVPEVLKPKPMAMRAQLWALSHDVPTPPLPAPGLVSIPADGVTALSWPKGFAEIMGWVPAGPILVRLDVAERVAGELGYLTRRAAAPLPPEVLGRFGIKGEQLGEVLAGLGFRLIAPEPLGEGVEGPLPPVMVSWARPERAPRREGGRPPRRDDRRAAPAEGDARRGPARRRGRGAAPRPRPRVVRAGPMRARLRAGAREGSGRDGRGAAPAARGQGAPPACRRRSPQGADGASRVEAEAPAAARGTTGGGTTRPAPRRPAALRRAAPRRPAARPGATTGMAGRGSQRGGPETRTFHEDRPTTSAEDSPFAALMKLKLK